MVASSAFILIYCYANADTNTSENCHEKQVEKLRFIVRVVLLVLAVGVP
jgi:hypothetical protein